jgi:hypothetical protein
MKLFRLRLLQQLTVIAPGLETLMVTGCFTNPPNPDLSVANIKAPQLTWLMWMNVHHLSSIQVNTMKHLQRLTIKLYILLGYEKDFDHNHYWMTLLRRFQLIQALDLVIYYPRVSPFLYYHSIIVMCH